MTEAEYQEEYKRCLSDFNYWKEHYVTFSAPERLEEAADKYAERLTTEPYLQVVHKTDFIAGAKWQKDKVLKLIEIRISEIIGDAQPNSVLRIELQGIIDKIK